MIRWAQAVRGRDQIVFFAPTLEEAISEDHSVRLFDEVIGKLDFTEWEQSYERVDGRPPIHPRVMAEVILYGLSLGIRSSRKLEDACINRLDFLWLTEGRSIDHSTLAGFRVRFAEKLKGMFRQIGRLAIGLGMVNLNQVALDGTVKRANNSRYAVSREENLEQKLAVLDQQVESLINESLATDRQEQELFGESSPTKLPRELRDLKARQERLAAALKKARAMEARNKPREQKPADEKPTDEKTADEERADEKTADEKTARARGAVKSGGESGGAEKAGDEKAGVAKAGPAVPTTDPDASLMKNKTGGFAPNYLVVLATEGNNGLIVDYQVPATSDEPSTVLPAMANLRESFGGDGDAGVVKELLADGGFNSGANLDALQTSGIQPWMAPKRSGNTGGGSAGKTLDKSRFAYDPASDLYRCPAGRSLPFWKNDSEKREGGVAKIRLYRSTDCGNCALASRCLSAQNKSKVRTIGRDQYEPLREQMAQRMNSDAGRDKYRRRSHLAETPFAVLNTSMNVIQLLLRGTAKVTAEVGWICSAYNLKKITRLLAASRQPATTNTA